LRAVSECDVLVLPGVGSYSTATDALNGAARTQLQSAIAQGLPVLGICLGMQMLFDSSEEGGDAGLGVIAGRVRRLRAKRIPQIGWNVIEHARSDLSMPRFGYYANSFVCEPRSSDVVAAWSTHEDDRFPAIVLSGRVAGAQFHPEKSSLEGLQLIRELTTMITQ
jgi:imidazole glycerol-phosphate synthase subunit HisH